MKQKRCTLNGYLLEKKGLLFVFAFTTLFLAIVAPLKSYIMQWLLDAPNKESAMLNLIKGLIIVLLSHILEWISRMSFTKMVCQACQQIRNMIMLRQIEKEMQTYLSENSGDILSALTNDMRVIYDEYYMSVFNIFMWGSMMSVALFMIASISPILLAVSLILGSAPLIVPRVLAKKMGRLREEYSQKMANYTIKVNELLKGFETLMLSNTFFYLLKNHNRVSEEVFEGEYRTQSMLNTTMVISSFISWIPNIMVLLFGVLLVYDGRLTMGYLVTAHTLSNFVISPARMVSDAYAKLKATKKIKEKLETIMNVKEHSSE
ncbi:MAG: ABC transporter ATP-binding protein, partial [bacterium]|nr:ABC transporter ATP-binding protein [bacterium]